MESGIVVNGILYSGGYTPDLLQKHVYTWRDISLCVGCGNNGTVDHFVNGTVSTQTSSPRVLLIRDKQSQHKGKV